MDFREVDGCMDWIDLAQDRDRWLALVNAVMNIRVHKRREIRVAEELSGRTLLHGVRGVD